jgi:uncharacterized RDD family membrane protein YckC
VTARAGGEASLLGTRAGVVTRTIASAIDLVVILLAVIALYFTISGVIFILPPRAFKFPQFSTLHILVAGEVMLFLYLAIGWMNTGRSVGKQLMGLRVMETGGGKVRPSRALLRSATCVLLPVSLFWCLVDPKNRAVHDILLGTVVVYDWSLRPIPSSPAELSSAALPREVTEAPPGDSRAVTSS